MGGMDPCIAACLCTTGERVTGHVTGARVGIDGDREGGNGGSLVRWRGENGGRIVWHRSSAMNRPVGWCTG